MIDLGIFIGGISLLFFYRYSFGYGKAQHEKLWAIMTCTILNMVLLAEVRKLFERNSSEQILNPSTLLFSFVPFVTMLKKIPLLFAVFPYFLDLSY